MAYSANSNNITKVSYMDSVPFGTFPDMFNLIREKYRGDRLLVTYMNSVLNSRRIGEMLDKENPENGMRFMKGYEAVIWAPLPMQITEDFDGGKNWFSKLSDGGYDGEKIMLLKPEDRAYSELGARSSDKVFILDNKDEIANELCKEFLKLKL